MKPSRCFGWSIIEKQQKQSTSPSLLTQISTHTKHLNKGKGFQTHRCVERQHCMELKNAFDNKKEKSNIASTSKRKNRITLNRPFTSFKTTTRSIKTNEITGQPTHQREAVQNHSPKYKGRCSWCSYSMRHIQRPVVCWVLES
jgi:hypothetical protein